MSDYEIIKGVTVPPFTTRPDKRFPFEQLEVGDGFKVLMSEIKETAARNQISKWSRKLGRRFRVAPVDHEYCLFWRES